MDAPALDHGDLSAAQLDGDCPQAALDAGDGPAADGAPDAKSSKYRGVSWHRKSGRWRATIKLQGSKIQIGAYRDEEEAARAFDGAAVRYRGSSAITNFDISDYLAEQIEHEERAQLQVPLVSKKRNPTGSFLDMSGVPALAAFTPDIQPGPPPVPGNPDVPECDVDVEQREMALQWARAKLYLAEVAAQHSKPLKRARLGPDPVRGLAKADDAHCQ